MTIIIFGHRRVNYFVKSEVFQSCDANYLINFLKNYINQT